MTQHHPDEHDGTDKGPVVRDRRRIDPVTGEVRSRGEGAAAPGPQTSADGPADSTTREGGGSGPTGGAGGQAAGSSREVELAEKLADLTATLQRNQADFINYKRRIERDRLVARDVAIAGVLTELLPVVDDIGRAREHGELEGGFKAVAEALEAVLSKVGLEHYGEVGEPFDPRIHEALMHSYSDQVTEATNAAILQPGYRFGERVLRAARVAVAEPTEGLPEPGDGPTSGLADGPPPQQ